ncbi:MAG: hypothetical protein ABI687_01330, partial [Flavitalea sp.]
KDQLTNKNKVSRIDLNREIAAILERIYYYPEVYYEVNAAIYSGYYEDERVLIKDLLFPQISGLYQHKRFKVFKSIAGRFRKFFMDEVKRGKYSLTQSALGEEEQKTVVTSEGLMPGRLQGLANPLLQTLLSTAIYFPYSDNFTVQFTSLYNEMISKTVSVPAATIVSADRDADAAPGREAYSCGLGAVASCYKTVTVDDAYASAKATHIITSGAERSVADAAIEPVSGVAISRVYHGWSKLTQQLDKLISFTGNGGGSEIKIARISGYLQTKEQQVVSFSGDIATVYYKRGDIRYQRWKRVFSVWDVDWKEDNKEQVYAVYEDDTQGTKKLKGSLTTTINLPGKPSPGKTVADISFDVSVITQDEIITQRNIDRYSYFRDAKNNQGWGYLGDTNDFLSAGKDWPVLDGGAVWSYTLPNRGY